MAQTVTFNGAAFEISNIGGGGSNSLVPQASDFNSANGAPSYSFQNSNKSAINGLGFQDNSSAGINLAISSRGKDSALNSTFSFGDANDTLIIGSSLMNQFFMGNGNNTVTFSFRSNKDVVNVGDGADTIIFGQSVNNSLVQLTTDTSVDTIRLSTNTNPTDLRITGATDIDVLFIGSTQYNYDSSINRWVNESNPSDQKNFS